MLNELALVLSSLSIGSVLGVYLKAALDQRHFKFSKAFEYKEVRYKAITLQMWIAMKPDEDEIELLRLRRPDIDTLDKLSKELELEYYNAMLYASKKVLRRLKVFLDDKNVDNWCTVTRAMKRDLYL